MSNGLFIAIQALLGDINVTGVVGQRIYPVEAPQGAEPPNIVVHMIAEPVDPLLCEDAPVTRVQIDCRGASATEAVTLGETVKTALSLVVNQTVAGRRATFSKEGSDATGKKDHSDHIVRSIDYNINHWTS